MLTVVDGAAFLRDFGSAERLAERGLQAGATTSAAWSTCWRNRSNSPTCS